MFSPELPYPLEARFSKLDSIKLELPPNPTHIDFAYVNHGATTPFPKDIKETIEETDLIVLEGVLWTERKLDIMNRISAGDRTALQEYLTDWVAASPQPGFDRTRARAIFGSRKPVRFCDIPFSEENKAAASGILEARLTPQNVKSTNDLQRLANNYMTNFIKTGIYERDKYIIQNIYPTLGEFSDEENSMPLNALFVLGSVHRTVSLKLRQSINEADTSGTHSVSETMYSRADGMVEMYEDFLHGKKSSDIHIMKQFLTVNLPVGIRPDEDVIARADSAQMQKIMVSVLRTVGIRV